MSYANEFETEDETEDATGQQFEHLPFALDGELESERGARSYRPPLMRARPMQRSPAPRRPKPLPAPRARRPYSRWPYPRWPYYGGGWPYGAVQSFPAPFSEPFSDSFAEPASEPFQEPFSHSADFGAGPPDENEAPPLLRATLSNLPPNVKPPAYQALGSIAAAIANTRSAVPGLYLIEFTSEGRRRAYSGQSDNVRRRLQQHQLCAHMLGLSLASHKVYVAPLPKLAKDGRRALEKAIHTDMFANHGRVLTNQRRELEVGLLGAQWE